LYNATLQKGKTMSKKLFLGIALDKSQIQMIGRLQENFDPGVRLIPAANLHMTIAFFGLVSAQQQAELETQLSAIAKRRFSVTLDTLAYWHKPRILCIKGQADDKALLQIVSKSQALAASLGLYESEHSFTAHITVARKAKNMPASELNFNPLRITPSVIHLFESKNSSQGVEYPILRSWALQ
jgi:2'-5' RNA ligase